jgi:rfaE bifunctional protein kinase chain/domain
LTKQEITSETLLTLLDSLRGKDIAVIGDIMLDRYIFGSVDRISPEAPVPVVHVRRTEDRLGGAGNVVRNLCNLHANVRLCGLIGDDSEGKVLLSILEKQGVNTDGVVIDKSNPTTTKTRVIAQRQQVVRIDREDYRRVNPGEAAEFEKKYVDKLLSVLNGVSTIIISDYGKGAINQLLLQKIDEYRDIAKNKKQNVLLVVDPHPTHYSLYKHMSVGKPNRREAEIASGIKIDSRESAAQAAHVLIERWKAEMMLVSLGESGLLIAQSGDKQDIFLETVAQEVSDVSGAGDTVTAVFSLAMASGATPEVAGHLANLAAGIVVSEVGTVPVDINKLKSEIGRI